MKVSVKNLHKSYPTPAERLRVLDGLDLELASGDAVSVVGPSGCGKSTLLHILGTLDTPTEGQVLLNERDPFALSERELAQFRNEHVGLVFQDHYLLPQCTVLENVLVPTLVSRERSGEVSERARELLAQVGLDQRIDHRPAELSGGERQRAALARAMIQQPGLLLCDEPTGNLDSGTARAVGDLLLRLHEEVGYTLVAVTHSLELAGRFPRRVSLQTGRLVDDH